MPELVELIGVRKIRNDLRLISENLALMPEKVMHLEIEILEESERALFESYGGRFQRTGDLMRSLTESGAEGAIRRAHGTGLEFGTSIWYAKFQRKINGPSGKPRGRTRVGPNLVLKFTPKMRQTAARAVADAIWGDFLGVGRTVE